MKTFKVLSLLLSYPEAELIAHLDGRLARYKIPKSVMFTSQLPHNASGKLAKPALRHAYGVTAGEQGRS